ncbi:MAG: TIGR00366 family protein [Proteobacteria bacterium]|nr:TIGR00366 family protein [Pseudomonadota bacterium]MBU1745938.1 TIGR00366 family protein [Pseudomonadota bacterium]MBU1965974.1 TIGR00366 family protein [Pseudomonadota bacterium]MBU4370929.1 TIGR00366 family protein [Pseudomonadota bacterium]MBU4582158.1 TIGR00366 family protein [Pseudomonadota bacterium]
MTRWTERWIPDALVIVIVLSLVTYIFALIWGFKPEVSLGSRAYESIQAWGKGFWELLTFAMQMCLIMMTGYILACSPPVRRLLNGLSGLANPEKPWQAILVMSLFSMIMAWLNWGLSLIASAMLALFIVKRNPKVDYRLLVAAAYLGLGCTWHAGLSGSATLLVATPDNFMIKGKLLDATIPVANTIFHPFNLILTVIVVAAVTILMALMHPRPEKTYVVKPELMDQLKLYEAPPKPAKWESPSDWMNWWPGFNLIVFIGGLIWLIWHFSTKGLDLNLNVVNFAMLMLGILFHWRPWSFLKATEDAGKAVWGIVIQFPFYAGILGLFKFTLLSTVFTQAFVAISTPQTFPLFVYWYGGILNYLIPSGGGEWAVVAPYIIPAAKQLGVGMGTTVVTFAWADMMTDMIQPFWAIAMLAVAKLHFRDIMGYLLLVFFVYFIITSLAFLFFIPNW